MMQYKLSEIIAKLGGQLQGEDVCVTGIAPTDTAQSGQITYVTAEKYLKQIASCEASALIINEKHAHLADSTMPKIICRDANFYFSKVVRLFYPEKNLSPGIRNSVQIAPTSTVGDNAAIENNVVIGENCKIGTNCQIYPNVVIADNVVIGDNVVIYPNVTLYSNVKMGDNCILHAGVVVGSAGFGNVQDEKKHWHKIPQLGGVIIGNDVDIGANTTIDCGAMSPTIIGNGVVIDNLVQIAHNVVIGDYVAIAACVGIAGSTKIGKYCQLAGAASIAGHLDIADHTVIGGFTGIGKSIQTPDLYMGAFPATPYKEYAKNAVRIKELNNMYQRLRELETQVKNLLGGK